MHPLSEPELIAMLEHAEQNVGVYKLLEEKDPVYKEHKTFWNGAVWAFKKALGRTPP